MTYQEESQKATEEGWLTNRFILCLALLLALLCALALFQASNCIFVFGSIPDHWFCDNKELLVALNTRLLSTIFLAPFLVSATLSNIVVGPNIKASDPGALYIVLVTAFIVSLLFFTLLGILLKKLLKKLNL